MLSSYPCVKNSMGGAGRDPSSSVPGAEGKLLPGQSPPFLYKMKSNSSYVDTKYTGQQWRPKLQKNESQ